MVNYLPESYKGRVFLQRWVDEKAIKELIFLKEKFTNTRTCIDIGAHIGACSVKYAKIFNQVHSFEPNPKIYSLLEKNTKEYENINVYNRAASDYTGQLKFISNKKNTEQSKVLYEDVPLHEHIDVITINCIPIDSYLFNQVDFIKIDTEGHNLNLIKGMMDTLKNNNPILQIEVFDKKQFEEDNNKVFNILKNLNYKQIHKMKDDLFFQKMDQL